MENNDNKYPSLEESGEEIDYSAGRASDSEIRDASDRGQIIQSDADYDRDMWKTDVPKRSVAADRVTRQIFDFIEMLALVTVSIILCFSFVFRLNIVDGPSMEETLHSGEYLFVSDLFYTPKMGDIVVVHDMTAGNYAEPIVKRVIAVGGQTVDIDFSTWTLTVDGKEVDESSYRNITSDRLFTSNYEFPVTVEEGHVFVMGDNRNHSADSRISEIGQIDERCIVGRVYFRIFPISKFKVFRNPFDS